MAGVGSTTDGNKGSQELGRAGSTLQLICSLSLHQEGGEGLAWPSLTGVHKKLQASRMVQLVLSHDPGIRKVANLRLLEKKSKRIKFKPAVLVDSVRRQNLLQSCRALKRSVKSILAEEKDNL